MEINKTGPRVSYVIGICLIALRHVVKYLYIFKWKYVVWLNDDFFARYEPFIRGINLSSEVQIFDQRYESLIRGTNLSSEVQTFHQKYKPFIRSTNLS
jgi:hypothetical protein